MVTCDGVTPVTLTVRALSLPVPGGEDPPRITVDLSPIGGHAETPIYDDGTQGDATGDDGIYTVQATIAPEVQTGVKRLDITLEDAFSQKGYAFVLLAVYPVGEEFVYQDEVKAGWSFEVRNGESDPEARDIVHGGSHAQAITLQTGGSIKYTFEDLDGFSTFGYAALEFWIHPRTSTTEKATLGPSTAEAVKYLSRPT